MTTAKACRAAWKNAIAANKARQRNRRGRRPQGLGQMGDRPATGSGLM